jgi:hypothetical protein
VHEAEREDGDSRVRLHAERLESPHVLKGLVDDRQPDDGVDDVGVGADVAERAGQERDAVPYGKETDVEQDVLEPVEEEDHADRNSR